MTINMQYQWPITSTRIFRRDKHTTFIFWERTCCRCGDRINKCFSVVYTSCRHLGGSNHSRDWPIPPHDEIASNWHFLGRAPLSSCNSAREPHWKIRKVEGFDRAKVYQARMDHLGAYSLDLQNLKCANLVDAAQLVLGNLRAEQNIFVKKLKKR